MVCVGETTAPRGDHVDADVKRMRSEDVKVSMIMGLVPVISSRVCGENGGRV